MLGISLESKALDEESEETDSSIERLMGYLSQGSRAVV